MGNILSESNALVICNHAPPTPWNSGDFHPNPSLRLQRRFRPKWPCKQDRRPPLEFHGLNFFPSKSLLEAPHCGDKQMVKSWLNDPALRVSSGWSSPGFRFRYIQFPLALVCLPEVTILTFTVISGMVETAQQILGQILYICISSHN